MTYLLLTLPFVVSAAIAGVLLARRSPRAHWVAVALATAALVVLTAVFDSLMITAGLFRYDAEQLLGATIGLAPIEDFGYPIVCALLLPAVWVAVRGARTRAREGGDGDPDR